MPPSDLCAFLLMFPGCDRLMLASMSKTEWSDLVVGGVMGELPTGTVTLLLADVEGSTRLWQTQPDEMTAAVARLDTTLADLLAAHGGVQPVEQGEGDSFRRGVRACQRRGGVRPGIAAGAVGAAPATHRCAHRAGAVA